MLPLRMIFLPLRMIFCLGTCRSSHGGCEVVHMGPHTSRYCFRSGYYMTSMILCPLSRIFCCAIKVWPVSAHTVSNTS